MTLSALPDTCTPDFARRGIASGRLDNHVFRPPLTPGSPYNTHTSLAPEQDHSQLSVARHRLKPSTLYNACATLDGTTLPQDPCFPNTTARSASPAPLANTSYALAGGYDTPTLAATSHFERWDARDNGFRKRWDDGVESPLGQDYLSGGPLARERNGRSRLTSTYSYVDQQPTGWSKYVFSLATSVAGKIVSFCRESAFRGFHAGGGKGYDFSQPTQLEIDRSWDGYFASASPIPGHYPRERDFSGDFEQDNTTCTPRPAKRIHTDSGNGWVVVDGDLATREESPRLTTRKVSNPLLSINRPAASRASSRRSLIPVSRRTASFASNTGSPLPTRPSFDGSAPSTTFTVTNHDRRASTALTRSPIRHNHSSRPASAELPPLSPQAQKILAKRAKADKETDKSMSKMSKQLQDLIRQGQAALGTTFQIEDDHVDEGFEDGSIDGWEDAGVEATAKW